MDGEASATHVTPRATDEAFRRRLAAVLAERRRQRGTSIRSLARESRRSFTAQQLRAYEAARGPLDAERVEGVAALYGIDVADLASSRVTVVIDGSRLSTNGVSVPFDPDDEHSLLLAYLRLVRRMRAQEQLPAVQLRREDVEVLAAHLHAPGETIVDRLGALMGATVTERRAMAGLFLAGALVIGLAGGSVAAWSGGTDGSGASGFGTPPPVAVSTDTADPATSSAVVTSSVAPAATPATANAGGHPTVVVDGDDSARAPATSAPATSSTASSTTSSTTSSPSSVQEFAVPGSTPVSPASAASPRTAVTSPTTSTAAPTTEPTTDRPDDGGLDVATDLGVGVDAGAVGAGGSLYSDDVPIAATPITGVAPTTAPATTAPVTTAPVTTAPAAEPDMGVALPEVGVGGPPLPATSAPAADGAP